MKSRIIKQGTPLMRVDGKLQRVPVSDKYVASQIRISPNVHTIVIPSQGYKDELVKYYIAGTTNWTVTSNASWILISKYKNYFTINAMANSGETERSSTLTIHMGSATKIVSVEQDIAPIQSKYMFSAKNTIGLGQNITGDYFKPQLLNRIIDFDAIIDEDRLYTIRPLETNIRTHIGTSYVSYSHELINDVEVDVSAGFGNPSQKAKEEKEKDKSESKSDSSKPKDGKDKGNSICGFQASVNYKNSRTETHSNTTEDAFATTSIEVFKRAIMLENHRNVSDYIYPYLNKNFLRDVENLDINSHSSIYYFINKYGTHVITGFNVGAKFTIKQTLKKTKTVDKSDVSKAVTTNLNVAFKGFYFGNTNSISSQEKKDVESNFSDETIELCSVGGPSLRVRMDADDLNNWINGVNDSNITYAGPVEGGMPPIYSLFRKGTPQYDKLYNAIGYYLYREGVYIELNSKSASGVKVLPKLQLGWKCDHDKDNITYVNKVAEILKGDGQVGSANGKETYWWIDFQPIKISETKADLHYRFFVQESNNDRTTLMLEDTKTFTLPKGFKLLDGPSRVGGFINYQNRMQWIEIPNIHGTVYIYNRGYYIIDVLKSKGKNYTRFSNLITYTPFIEGAFKVRLDNQAVDYDHYRVAFKGNLQLRYKVDSEIGY